MNPFRIAQVGPESQNRCGISDYAQALQPALEQAADAVFLPYRKALAPGALRDFDAVLVHYERTLVPEFGYLRALTAAHPGVFVVPHEVYAEDPFAFPYSELRSFPGLLWAKRWWYRRRHHDFFRETDLQRAGYHARGVFPLNAQAHGVLRRRCPENLRETVPHAVFPAPAAKPVAPRARFFPRGQPSFVLGIFGFLTPAHDYEAVFEVLAFMPDAGLLILGGTRSGPGLEPAIQAAARNRGVADRIALSGFIPEAELGSHLALPDAFVFPARFKSSSGSLLRLFALSKPILASDLPLTRELREEGGPLLLYRNALELDALLGKVRSGQLALPENRYPHNFASVAETYVKAMRGVMTPPLTPLGEGAGGEINN
jgi:glycosyltransferase involved in cell wall biosynthesis